MSVADLYRNRGVNPLAVQSPITRLLADANTVNLWQFNEGAGVKVRDYGSDMGAGAVVTNMTWTLNGPFGSALNMDAANNGNGLLATVSAVTGSQTMEFVFRPRQALTTYASLFEYGNSYSSMTLDGIYWPGAGILCRLRSSAGAYMEVNPSTTFTNGVWHYLAYVFNAGATLKAYTDGVETGTADASAFGTTLASNTSMVFGRRGTGDAQYPALWEFAAIRHSNVARSAAEILTNAKLMGFA